MRKDIRVPLTLEDVGNVGSYFGDLIFVKVGSTLILVFFLSMIIAGQLMRFVSPVPALIISLLPSLKVAELIARRLIFKESELKIIAGSLYSDRRSKVNKYSDIYLVRDGVCNHIDGHVSVFVEVMVGTTIDMDDIEIADYYNSFVTSLMQLNSKTYEYTVDIYDLDGTVNDDSFDFIKFKNLTAHKIGNEALTNVTRMKNSYVREFANANAHVRSLVFKITGPKRVESKIRSQVVGCMRQLSSRNIAGCRILDTEASLNDFGRDYFDCEYFNIININPNLREIDVDAEIGDPFTVKEEYL